MKTERIRQRDIHVRPLIGWSPTAPSPSISAALGIIGYALILGFYMARAMG